MTRIQQGVPSSRKRKPRRLGYIRFSDDSQNAALQLDAMKAAGCDRLFCDPAVSGRSAKRTELYRALRTLREGDTLVVWKIDRLGRYDTELLMMRDEFIRRRITLISITQGIDTRTAMGRFTFGQLALFATLEIENLSERTRAGMAAAKARGVHVGRISNAELRRAHHRLQAGGEGIGPLGQRLGVSEVTLRRGFTRLGLTP